MNKAGAIAGNYYSVLTDTNLPVHGSVDPKTQRAAWTVGDKTTTVFDAGIYNLTQDQAPVLIHVGTIKTQQWMLVRLKQPEGQAAHRRPLRGPGGARKRRAVRETETGQSDFFISRRMKSSWPLLSLHDLCRPQGGNRGPIRFLEICRRRRPGGDIR